MGSRSVSQASSGRYLGNGLFQNRETERTKPGFKTAVPRVTKPIAFRAGFSRGLFALSEQEDCGPPPSTGARDRHALQGMKAGVPICSPTAARPFLIIVVDIIIEEGSSFCRARPVRG